MRGIKMGKGKKRGVSKQRAYAIQREILVASVVSHLSEDSVNSFDREWEWELLRIDIEDAMKDGDTEATTRARIFDGNR